jgi:hypothetical protein
MNDSDDLVPPTSSRKARPMRDVLPLDDGLPGVIDPDAMPAPESVERPPASRKLTSVRGTELDLDIEDFSRWEIDGVAAEPPSTLNVGRPVATPADTLAPDIVRRTLPETELVVLVSSTRSQRPATFGELLDLALELGE